MIDIHCHILPESDDGAINLEMSLQMGKIAEEDGITDIVATPHFSDLFNNKPHIVKEKIEQLQEKFDENNINIKLHFGLEVQLDAELIDKYSEKLELLTINQQGKYILLELPFLDIPLFMNDVVRYLYSCNIIPIIVHPLRNARILQNPLILSSLKENGALFQLDKGAVKNSYTIKTLSIVKKMIKNNYVHFIASDAHRIDMRRPTLKYAYNIIEKKLGKDVAEKLFLENPNNLINGKKIYEMHLNNFGFFDKIKNIFN